MKTETFSATLALLKRSRSKHEKVFSVKYGICKYFDWGGGVKCVYAAQGSLLEITDDAMQAPVPDVSAWEVGKLNPNERKFDLSVKGKGIISADPNNIVELYVEGRETPELFALNSDGTLVFSAPQPMAAVKMPCGHESWVRIQLENVRGNTDGDAAAQHVRDYVCLGVRRQGGEVFATLYAPVSDNPDSEKNILKAHVKMLSEDTVELVPLVSTTSLSGQYTKAEIGAEAAGPFIPAAGETFDLSSVYRVNVKPVAADEVRLDNITWEEAVCDLANIKADDGSAYVWNNYGHMGVGTVNGKANQMLALSTAGQLAYSENGINWHDLGANVNTGETPVDGWNLGPAFGNDVWCVIGDKEASYSADGSDWLRISKPSDNRIRNSNILIFDGSDFITLASKFSFYTSSDGAEFLANSSVLHRIRAIAVYGNEYLGVADYVAAGGGDYSNGVLICTKVSDEINFSHKYELGITSYSPKVGFCHSASFTYGYYYVLQEDGILKRSLDASTKESWKTVKTLPASDDLRYYNITMFNEKMYIYSADGAHCYIGTFS